MDVLCTAGPLDYEDFLTQLKSAPALKAPNPGGRLERGARIISVSGRDVSTAVIHQCEIRS